MKFVYQSVHSLKGGEGWGKVQFPCTIPELGTSLADVKMADLRGGYASAIDRRKRFLVDVEVGWRVQGQLHSTPGTQRQL